MKKIILSGLPALLSLVVLFSACQNSKIDYSYPINPQNLRNQRAGKFFDDNNLLNNKKNPDQKTADKKNPSPLWIASIEVIGALLPIETADENSGLIITEWYQDGQNKNERIKINLLVKGIDPKRENLLLTIFRQTKNSKGIWIDSQSSTTSLTAQMIKDKIIRVIAKP